MVDWYFLESSPKAKRRDPAWAEFFHSASTIKDNCSALVREAFQNSLDAGTADHPVRIRLALSGEGAALASDSVSGYMEGLEAHVAASGITTEEPFGRDCRFLLIEDFGTTGLLGDPAATCEPADDVRNDFYYFFRHEGKSGKRGSERGRWGIGRFVFPMSSEAYSLFGLTVRADPEDTWDEGAGLLLGTAVLKNHAVDGTNFEPDGYWGVDGGEELPMVPITDARVINQFRQDWSIARTTEPGLSIVVPYLESGWSVDGIMAAVVEDYFAPVSQGRLIVDVDDLTTGTSKRIDESSVRTVIRNLADTGLASRLERDMDLLKWASTATPVHTTSGYNGSKRPEWGATIELDEAALAAARTEFEASGRVLVRVPISVQKDKDAPAESYIAVVLSDEPQSKELATFIRSGIRVSQAGRSVVHGVRALVLIDDASASRMFGDAEGPAHVDWSDQTKSFRSRYKHGSSWLTLVRRSPEQLLKRLRGLTDGRDETIAADFFPLPDNGPKKGSARQPTARRRTPSTKRSFSPFEARVNDLGKVEIRLSAAGKANATRALSATAAYATRGTRAISSWEEHDFTLNADVVSTPNDVVVEFRGGHGSAQNNTIEAVIDDPETFCVELTGFDPQRDVVFDLEEGDSK